MATLSTINTDTSSSGAVVEVVIDKDNNGGADVGIATNFNCTVVATVSGATEIMDHGISNGTRSGNFVVSVKENTTPLTSSAISTTFSSTMYAVANSCVAFRGKISGE